MYTAQDVEILVATMHQTDRTLAHKMRIHSNCVIANQTSVDDVEIIENPLVRETWVNSSTVGVGKNRNLALDYASANLVVFGDDDMVYHEQAAELVARAFNELPRADVIFFNLAEPDAKRFRATEVKRVHWWNFLRFGTARAAAKRSAIESHGLRFHEGFGGGTPRSHGEDTIFFANCLRHGLRLYMVPVEIARLTEERPSTWNSGEVTEKYIRDQGALFAAMSPRFWPLWCAQDALRRRRYYSRGIFRTLILMRTGAAEFRRRGE